MKKAVYRWVALIILLIGIIPTASSFYRGFPGINRQVALRIPEKIADMSGSQSKRKAYNVKKVFNTDDWIEKIYSDAEGNRITLFVARGYDPRPFFHFPERGLLARNWSERSYTIDDVFATGFAYHVHQLILKGMKTSQYADYLLLHDGTSIGNPYLYLLKNAPMTMFHGRQPYTMIFVSYYSNGNAAIEEKARRILLKTAERVG